MDTSATAPLSAVELATGADPRHAIIWLHGLGADGNDFVPIVPELTRGLPPLRLVFPHAPLRGVTLNGGLRMRAWYDIRSLDLRERVDHAGLQQSVAQVQALLLREQHEHGIAPAHVVLAGFSQGGAIALSAGLRHAKRLAGIVALSTYLPIADTLAAERSAANTDVPIFQAHGTFDPVVIPPRGSDSRDLLQRLGYRVDWHSYPMAHAVCAEEIADLRGWLGRRFPA